MSILTDLERSVKLERGIAGLPAPQRAAARRQARLGITPAAGTGPVGMDVPRAAFRQDRLIVATLGRMSEGELLDFVARWSGESGAWTEWVTEQAAARLVSEYGYAAGGE